MLANAAVLDPEAGALAEGRAVVVEDGRVVEVEATAAVRAGDGGVLDARGMTVMPGLIDAHVHLTSTGAAATRATPPRPGTDPLSRSWNFRGLEMSPKVPKNCDEERPFGRRPNRA